MLKDKIEGNKYKNEIVRASLLQDEASFYISHDTSNAFYLFFKKRILDIYVGDRHKYDRFFSAFCGTTIRSVELCDTVYKQLYRVWDSQDKVREHNFSDSDINSEAEKYLNEIFLNFWLNHWWEAYKYQFCSFIVTDLPEIQTTQFPEPYHYILDVSKVLFIEPTRDFNIKEIIFEEIKEEKKYWYWYTQEFYSKYLIDGENEYLIFNHPHQLKRNPVDFVWEEKYNSKSWILKKNAITPNLEDLFWIVMKSVESRKADLLYLNPYLQTPKISCGYDSTKGKHRHGYEGKCNGGYLYTHDNTPAVDNYFNPILCPNCGKLRHSGGGAGNQIQIDLDAQVIKDGKVDPSNTLVKFITPEVSGIKEQYKRLIDEEDRFIKNTVGSDEQPTKSALNELQQTAIFESRENVLKGVSENISKIITKHDWKLLTLRYSDKFVSNKYSQGSKFYLVNVSDLLDIREKSYNPLQKRQVDEQINEVRFKNNQKRKDEEKLLYKILPYNTLTDSEFITMVDSGKITNETDIALRLMFSNAIELFESEFGSIIEFYNFKFPEKTPEIKRLEIIRSLLIKSIKVNIKTEKNVQN